MTNLQQAMDIAEERAYQKRTPSLPPIDDTISTLKSIDWVEMRQRARSGLNNVGLVLAVLGEKVHDFGVFLATV
jgi:hypothetical protein